MPKRVLIVDDHPELRKLVRLTLQLQDFEIFEADSGRRALELCHAQSPHLVILDVMMPGELDGYATCAAIKADPAVSASKVILLTARAQQTDFDAGRKAGSDAYLTKPFSPLELIETVSRVLDGGSSPAALVAAAA